MKLRSNKNIDFPDVCILEASYKPILVQPKKYLGDKANHDRRNRFTATIALRDDAERIDFLRWWTVDLEYGIFPFNITLPIFGRNHKIQVQLINDLSSMETNGLLEATLELEQLGYIEATGMILNDLSVTGSNSCVVLVGDTSCAIENTITGVISGTPTGNVKYTWTVTGAVIKSGQGTDSVVIKTDSNSPISNIRAELTVADDKHSMTKNVLFSHTRTIQSPMVVSDISTTGDTSCVYGLNSSCTISNNASVTVTGTAHGTIVYDWTVTGAVIKSGQGTDSVVIESTGTAASTPISIKLTVHDDSITDMKTADIIHTRMDTCTAHSELITNGKFDTNTHGVDGAQDYNSGNPTIEWDAGTCKVTAPDRDNEYAEYVFGDMIVGQEYVAKADYLGDTTASNGLAFYQGNKILIGYFYTKNNGITHEFSFTATSNVGYFLISCAFDGQNTKPCIVDNLSVKCKV